MLYPLLRELFFLFDPEKVHAFAMNSLKAGCSTGFTRKMIQSYFQINNPAIEKNLWGLHFRNPVGLGAGFDKDATYLRELEALGFGFVEIGTVTPKGQPGNDRPRLFRLPKDKALINRMGFNNEGADIIARRLEQYKVKTRNDSNRMIIGGNIGKNKITPNEEAWKDYVICFDKLFEYVDYFVVNVSSPNTPGLRELQEKESLRKILSQLQQSNKGKAQPKPLLLKIAPDLSYEQIDDIISLAFEVELDGLVATNTTINRVQLGADSREKAEQIGAGGLSGKPLALHSTEVLQYISKHTQGKIPLIASGGIFNAKDVKEKTEAGAALIQVWTSFIYQGPAIVKQICKKLK